MTETLEPSALEAASSKLNELLGSRYHTMDDIARAVVAAYLAASPAPQPVAYGYLGYLVKPGSVLWDAAVAEGQPLYASAGGEEPDLMEFSEDNWPALRSRTGEGE